MNTRQMEYVIAVYEEKSISRAAQRLHISQPSLSQYIRSIEKSLEIELFDRTVSPIAPTDMGRIYISTAYKMLALENDLMKCIGDQREESVSQLNIGVSAYLNTGELSSVVAEIHAKYPSLRIYIHELFSVAMDEMIQQGELDFSISPIKDSYDTTRFCRDVVSRDRFYIAASRELLRKWVPELELAEDGDTAPLERFALAPFLTMDKRSLQTYSSEMAARQAGFEMNVILRCRRWQMLLELVGESAGVSLLTDRYLMDSVIPPEVVLLRPAEPVPELVGAVSYLRSAYMPKAARSFISCYKRTVGHSRNMQGFLEKGYL
ncbi:MAG: LysR family transcriptional regulator [Candidatus Heteroscillospira sp.]|jgi:DNA-binding transcriptional LysR family regulator